MNETMVTLTGWLGSDVTVRRAGDVEVAEFRVGATPRRYQRQNDSWVDGDTQWFTVKAWRRLGEHCARSLHSGDPVVVHGRLTATTWTNSAGIGVTSFDVDALFVGHDLSKGTAVFTKAPKGAGDVGESVEPTVESAAGSTAERTAESTAA